MKRKLFCSNNQQGSEIKIIKTLVINRRFIKEAMSMFVRKF